MKVVIQYRVVVHVEQIKAVVDDIDSTFVLVNGELIRVSERYRTHVKDAVFYWKGLFRKSNELLQKEIRQAWKTVELQFEVSEQLCLDEYGMQTDYVTTSEHIHKSNHFDETTEFNASTASTNCHDSDSSTIHNAPPDAL